MANGATTNVVLTDFVNLQRGHDPGHGTLSLQGILQGQGIHHGRQHTHLVRGNAIDSTGREARAAEQVTPTDDHADFDPGFAQ